MPFILNRFLQRKALLAQTITEEIFMKHTAECILLQNKTFQTTYAPVVVSIILFCSSMNSGMKTV